MRVSRMPLCEKKKEALDLVGRVKTDGITSYPVKYPSEGTPFPLSLLGSPMYVLLFLFCFKKLTLDNKDLATEGFPKRYVV